MGKMKHVLRWADMPGVDDLDIRSAPLPRSRPARVIDADGDPVAPWVAMSDAEIDAAIAASDKAWEEYDAAAVSDTDFGPTLIVAIDGSIWKIDATGRLIK